jgi:opacity protein-like surface antigen
MRKLAIAVALSSTVLATPALARDGAWYIGGDLGPMIVEDLEFDIGTTQNALSVDSEYGYDGDVFVGMDFGAFRVEGEVSYKKARAEQVGRDPSFATRLPWAGRRSSAVRDVGGSTSALSFMANAMLDFGDDEGISGFVGGGAGIARVKFNNMRVFENQGAVLRR